MTTTATKAQRTPEHDADLYTRGWNAGAATISQSANIRIAELELALTRIANMRNRDGDEIEMHRDELRGIARAALAKGQA